MNVLLWMLLVGGVLSIVMGVVMKTKNLQSSLLFKVLPLVFGVVQILVALNYLDIITIYANY